MNYVTRQVSLETSCSGEKKEGSGRVSKETSQQIESLIGLLCPFVKYSNSSIDWAPSRKLEPLHSPFCLERMVRGVPLRDTLRGDGAVVNEVESGD